MTRETLTPDELEHLTAALTAFMPTSDMHTEISATILRKLRDGEPAWRCTICGLIVDLRFEAEFPKQPLGLPTELPQDSQTMTERAPLFRAGDRARDPERSAAGRIAPGNQAMTTEALTPDELEHLTAALTAFMPTSDMHTEISATILRKLREPNPTWRCTICGWIVDTRFKPEFPATPTELPQETKP